MPPSLPLPCLTLTPCHSRIPIGSRSNHWFAVAARLGSGSKTQVTLRLDVEVVEKFRATGEGWQTPINDALKSWVRTHA